MLSAEQRRALKTLVYQLPSNYDADSENILSAVCILLIEQSNSLILTKRCDHLPSHPGQICFPGGKYSQEDTDLTSTAYRETWEEIGIERSRITQIGYLEAMHSLSGFFVQPIFGLIKCLEPYHINPSEVDELFTVPLDIVMDANNYQSHQLQRGDQSLRYYSLGYGKHHIWGITATILYKLGQSI